LFVIDAGKCFGPPPPGETVLKNNDFTAKGVLDTEQTLIVFLKIVVYHMIVGSLVTSL
jgi:hypothetical protein